jgi:hypothetical protein
MERENFSFTHQTSDELIVTGQACTVACVLVGNLVLSQRSNMSDIFLLGCNQRRQEFGLLSTSTQQSEFSVVPIGNKYTRISSSSQKKGGHHKF